MSEQDRLRVEQMLSYDEDTAGGLMNTDTITIHPRVTLDVVLRYLRMHKELPPTTDCVFVVNNDDQLVGLLPIAKLQCARSDGDRCAIHCSGYASQ